MDSSSLFTLSSPVLCSAKDPANGPPDTAIARSIPRNRKPRLLARPLLRTAPGPSFEVAHPAGRPSGRVGSASRTVHDPFDSDHGRDGAGSAISPRRRPNGRIQASTETLEAVVQRAQTARPTSGRLAPFSFAHVNGGRDQRPTAVVQLAVAQASSSVLGSYRP